MAVQTGALLEFYVPCVKFEGLKTNKDVSVGDGATVTLPSTTTIGGSAVVALGDITSSSTTASAFTVTNSGIFTGAKVVGITADSATTGTIVALSAAGLTSGHAMVLTSAGTVVTTGDVLSIVANSATTSTGLFRMSATSLTDGFLMALTGGGANVTGSGGGINLSLGAATVGTGIKVLTSGVYTEATSALVNISAASATSGNVLGVLTPSSKAFVVAAAYATPILQVDNSTASAVAGLKIKGAATGGIVALSAIDSGSNTSISIDAKGTGNIIVGGTSTGILSLGRTAAGVVFGNCVNTTIATQNGTPTAAQLLGGLITHTSTTGAGTLTTPTGTQISSAISGVATGDNFWVDYANVGNQTVTITAGASGVTLTGTAAVPSGKNAQMFWVCTGANTWICNITLSA